MQRWLASILSTHGAKSRGELAEKFLATLEGGTITDQLRQCRIAEVCLRPHGLRGIIDHIDGGRGFVVKLNKLPPLRSVVFTLGHELGHTFWFAPDVEGTLTMSRHAMEWQRESYESHESFCNLFARLWLARNGNRKASVDYLLSSARRCRWWDEEIRWRV